ncbi:MAG: hypothetical protein JST68_00500 [Bacteroidetes bacterium]|nr:hypothetical protein [Bacteroidota bacterium]
MQGRTKWILSIVMLSCAGVHAQSFEVQQLLLDYQKLTQQRQILNDLYKGYEILSAGYGAIRDVSKSSFDLYNAFLSNLLIPSPTVRSDYRVTNIISLQAQIVTAYKAAWTKYRQDPHLSASEIELIGSSFSTVIDLTLKDVETLTTLLTDGSIRAGDGERLRRLDLLNRSMQSHWVFLQSFVDQIAVLSTARSANENDYAKLRRWYGLTN